MENPQTWGLPEKVVRSVLAEQENILPEFRAGLSLQRQITDALRKEGLLREEPEDVKMLQKVQISRKKGMFGKQELSGFIDPRGRDLHEGHVVWLGGSPWTVIRVDEKMPEGEVPQSRRLDRAR